MCNCLSFHLWLLYWAWAGVVRICGSLRASSFSAYSSFAFIIGEHLLNAFIFILNCPFGLLSCRNSSCLKNMWDYGESGDSLCRDPEPRKLWKLQPKTKHTYEKQNVSHVSSKIKNFRASKTPSRKRKDSHRAGWNVGESHTWQEMCLPRHMWTTQDACQRVHGRVSPFPPSVSSTIILSYSFLLLGLPGLSAEAEGGGVQDWT